MDDSRLATQQLEKHLQSLQVSDAAVLTMSALDFLHRGSGAERYDIIFLDPPFNLGLMKQCIRLLEKQGWLSTSTYIYLEAESELQDLELPEDWEVLREKNAGQVVYRLARKR